jgi:Fe-S cluster biogenesis protein NfuA
MRLQIEAALEKIRPSLQRDGGDIELVGVSEDGVVTVRLTGACGGCPMSQMTLRHGRKAAQEWLMASRVESLSGLVFHETSQANVLIIHGRVSIRGTRHRLFLTMSRRDQLYLRATSAFLSASTFDILATDYRGAAATRSV